MASIDRSDPVILGHVLAEHRDLFSRMQAIKTAFTDRPRPTADRCAGIRAALADLREHLRTHFEFEEHGGFMEESIARMPRLGPAVAAVMKEHPTLLAELDTVIARLSGGDVSADAWVEAGRDFEHFAAVMRDHERSENAVVQEGYNEDLGLD